jgi:hypothetical protein
MNKLYDNDKAVVFLKHLAKSYIKSEKSGKSKKKLEDHFIKVKEVSLGKKSSKKKIELEFKRLDKLIKETVSLEKSSLSKNSTDVNTEIKKKIDELEHKFEKYISLIENRKEKIKKLEKKVKSKAKEEEKSLKITSDANEKHKLKNILFDLEQKYYDLKEKGLSQSKLKLIEFRIKKIKLKL